MKTEVKMQFKGLLFDLDGTLVDSNAAVDRSWMRWCERNDIDFAVASKVYHGRPAGETIKELLDGCDADKVEQEIAWLQHQESTDVEGVVALPGALDFIEKLSELNIPWAIVTSGTLPVATARIKAAKIPQPSVLITPERVSRGKPDPEPYVLGASELGFDAKDCVVFEDAPSGLISGNAAGAKTVGVLSQFKEEQLPKADAYVSAMEVVDVEGSEGDWALNFTQK
ncbi:HAD-IA family hydrolase [Vibrio hannami]|uniref:HAD-IA family hydrolase n=1 Tax=Vibrio hannami TaxID=2717094 RepID=UPI00240F65A4|nr:HAD-IA family hydrolase [Vibrio hannami]MDG3086355.1 HAD-IA family hydrolase [Vibrio hannami]